MYYILVEVTYDHFRFQDNITASIRKETCVDTANGLNRIKKAKDLYGLPIYHYDVESKFYEQLRKEQKDHYWVQKL